MKQHKLNPTLIKGTGKRGRITKEDVMNHINGITTVNDTINTVNNTVKSSINTPPPQHKCTPHTQDETIKLTGFHKAMTKTMTQSISIPSFLYSDEFNVDRLVSTRKEINKIEQGRIKFSYMPFFIKAVSLALNEYPNLNTIVNQQVGSDGYIQEYTIKKDHNISVAIDSPEGLAVPNIKRVQDKSVLEIQRELNELIDRAKNTRLSSSDLKDGTFTISNIGRY